jgi:cobalamin-dependent methionine synthase I
MVCAMSVMERTGIEPVTFGLQSPGRTGNHGSLVNVAIRVGLAVAIVAACGCPSY